MTTISPEVALPRPRVQHNPFAPLATLAARRFQLSARTPRELVVPLLTPILFALVIAPALRQALHTGAAYEAFVATGTIGLLIPLNTMFAGLGVIVDRESGAQRELLAAPIPRSLLVLGNLAVAFAITALQVAVLVGAAIARGIHFNVTATGVAWVRCRCGPLHRGHVRSGGNPCQPHSQGRGVHRSPPRDRDRALVPGRLAVSDQRAAQLPGVVREVPPPHPRARARPLRLARG